MARFGVSVAAIWVAVLAVSFASADDAEIARQISDGLHRERQTGKLRGFDILDHGHRRQSPLAGYVCIPKQLEVVEKIAVIVDGVKEVDNQLTEKRSARLRIDGKGGPETSERECGAIPSSVTARRGRRSRGQSNRSVPRAAFHYYILRKPLLSAEANRNGARRGSGSQRVGDTVAPDPFAPHRA
jgi:hypothetical protein